MNWGWTARLPGGSGADMTRVWGVQDNDPVGSESPVAAGSNSAEVQPDIEPRWAGKAPHRTYLPNMNKSKRWDADWWRLRMCGDTSRTRPRIPYGKVYEPGCMDGLWQGRMLVCISILFYSHLTFIFYIIDTSRGRDPKSAKQPCVPTTGAVQRTKPVRGDTSDIHSVERGAWHLW